MSLTKPTSGAMSGDQPSDADFDLELEAILGKSAAMPSESYDAFRKQFPSLSKMEDRGDPNSNCVNPLEPEPTKPAPGSFIDADPIVEILSKEEGKKIPIPESLKGVMDSGGYYFDESSIPTNEDIQKEWELAGKEGDSPERKEEPQEPAEVLDQNGVSVQPLPPASSGGFFLDGPTAVQVDNWSVPAGGGFDDDDLEVEQGEWVDIGGRENTSEVAPLAHSPPLSLDTSPESSYRMLTSKERPRRGATPPSGQPPAASKTPEPLVIEEMIIPPPRDHAAKPQLEDLEPFGESGASEESQEEPAQPVRRSPVGGVEAAPEQGSPLVVDQLPGMAEEPVATALVTPDSKAFAQLGVADDEKKEGDTEDAQREALGGAESTEEGVTSPEDEVQPFSLDPDFDYDNIDLTENPIGKMRAKWMRENGLQP